MHCAQLTLQNGRSRLGRGRFVSIKIFRSQIRKYVLRTVEIRMELICRKTALWRDLHFHFEKRLTRRDCRGTRCGCRYFCSSHLGDTPSIMRARSSCHSLRLAFLFYLSFPPLSASCSFCPFFCIFRAIFYRDKLFLLMRHLRMLFFLSWRARHAIVLSDRYRQTIVACLNSMIFVSFYFVTNLYHYVYVNLKYFHQICS